MNSIARALAVAALTLALASCGSEGEGGDTSSAPAAGQTSTASSAPPRDNTVTSVTVRRSGGLKGGTVKRSFVAGQAPPPGFTATEQDVVFEAAQKLVDADVTLDALPANTCCDRYSYVVVVGMADGTSTTYNALDGQSQPRVFEQLLTQLS